MDEVVLLSILIHIKFTIRISLGGISAGFIASKIIYGDRSWCALTDDTRNLASFEVVSLHKTEYIMRSNLVLASPTFR
jgi:hypothetical protein